MATITLLRCLTCQQPGMPVQLDEDGWLVDHPGRDFQCRVPLGDMPLPDVMPDPDAKGGPDAAEIVVGRYLQLLEVRNTPAFWEARNTGQEAAFWAEFYQIVTEEGGG